MKLGSDGKRRLALYGGAAVFSGLALWGIPALVSRLSAPLSIRRMDLEADAAMKTEAVKLLVEYVRIDTTNPPGITRPAIDFLARLLACEGIPATITGADPERPILVARIKGSSPDGALALLNHADVVPAGDPGAWTKPPFAAARGGGLERDHLIGRGTLDMKGQTIANFLAMASLRRAGLVPLRDIVFVVESGEETSREDLGMGWLFDNRPDLLTGVTDVFNEGGVNEVKVQHVERFGIETMQKAVLSVDVLSSEAETLE
ncbi:MAG: M20/M25/M40 family metallo-hydrolase [Thermoanaerobaculia bacterium]|nr:M20/M25/M40 family metallo-hydrolase [Thermoanaerobaculia bacterium]